MVRTAPAIIGMCGPGVTSRNKRKDVEISHFLSHNNNSKRLSGSPSGQAWLSVPICPSRFLSFPLAPVFRPPGPSDPWADRRAACLASELSWEVLDTQPHDSEPLPRPV